MSDLLAMSIEELRGRRALCDGFIRALIGENDPRAAEAIRHYTAELAELDRALTQKEQAERKRLGLPEPEPVIVGLKPAQLFGKAQ